MTITPAVELRFHPTDLDHAALREAIRPPGTPSEAIEAALVMARLSVITAAKAEVAQLTGEMSAAKLIGAADLAWQLYAPKFVRTLGPVFAAQYYETMKAAGAGEIPMSTVYALAEQHASRIGTYYHESNRTALVSGFNTFVNRRMTERVAADRVLDGYGLTSRGMAGYTSRALDKAATSTPLKLKQRALDYIGTSVRRRSKIFATQEEHNISQQAEQIAWMWLQDKGKLTPAAEKVWITARDEKVCKICGPMHNTRVLLSERFTLPNQTKIYVPGVHPNCRCTVRLLDHPWNVAGTVTKADWDPQEHPRGGDPENAGRFSAKARTARPKPVAEAEDLAEFQQFLDQAAAQTETQPLAHDEALEVLGLVDVPKAVLAPLEALAPKPTLSSSAKAVLGPKAQLASSQPQLAPKAVLGEASQAKARLEPRARAKITAYERHWMVSDTEKAFLAYSEQARRKLQVPQPNKRVRRGTKWVTDDMGNPQPMYYVAGPWEAPDHNGRIELHDEMEFTGNAKRAADMAAQEFDQNVNDTAERINDNAENKITQRFGDGRRFEATIPEEQVYDIVGWAAYQDKPEDSDWRGDQTIGVTWKEVDKDDMPLPDGEEYADTVRYSDIAEEWHLEPSYFNVSVLVLTEGHSSTKGKTEQVNFRKKHGYDSWVTTGPYVASPANRVFVGKSLPIQFMDLVPEDPVTMEEDEPFIGWPEPSDEDLSDYDRGD